MTVSFSRARAGESVGDSPQLPTPHGVRGTGEGVVKADAYGHGAVEVARAEGRWS